MKNTALRNNLGLIVALGSVWGLTEFAFGMGLQKCATLYTGAILTGIAFFWLSFIWSITRRILPILIIVGIAMLFKFMDALFLPVAWNHGSILNPIFAFFTLMLGFLLLATLFKKRFFTSLLNRILIGAGAALVATALFPLVKFASGTPACIYAATNIPLAIYTAPVAIIISMITVPLGFIAAGWYTDRILRNQETHPASLLARLWSPALVIFCLLIITLIRII
ncbi:MAG: hypothetical protein ABFS28_13270 [Bacteroidota bacterium]